VLEVRKAGPDDVEPIKWALYGALDAGVEPWAELPLWLPDRESWFLMQREVPGWAAARPLEETARDTLEWDRSVSGDRPTLTREKEADVLSAAREA
jgi:2'-hydroxyisoflavone reductase